MCCSPAEYAPCRDTKDAAAGKHDSLSSLNQALTTGAADGLNRGTTYCTETIVRCTVGAATSMAAADEAKSTK